MKNWAAGREKRCWNGWKEFSGRRNLPDKPTLDRSSTAGKGQAVETLDRRCLLSATPIMQPDLVYFRGAAAPSATTSSSVQGYSPAQTSHAYGFDKISFDNGTVTGNGAGQTIAIIDAYNDPNITTDLGVFDSQFSLSAALLKIVNQSGGSSLPTTDPGWAGEISLDVEWAHASVRPTSFLCRPLRQHERLAGRGE